MRQVARHSCASCTIGCEHIYAGRDGRKTRVEYENVFALGPMCGVSDPDAVLAASARCDDLGLDTISAGGTIAWAMECAERGLIDAPWLRFGDGDALLKALDQIGDREGLGDLLAEGSRRAAQRVGEGSAAFAPHVKGMEMPGYEPRTLHAMALGLAVNARGADHNRSGAYEADLSGDLDRLDGGDAHVAAAVETEDRAAVMDSLILCKFLRGVFTDPFTEWASLLSAVTGWDVDGAELRRTARRIVLAKRVYNIREGWRPADDWLPERLLTEPLRLASGRDGPAHPGPAAGHDRRVLRDARARRSGPARPGPARGPPLELNCRPGGYCIHGYHGRTHAIAPGPSRSRSTGARSPPPKDRRSGRPPRPPASTFPCSATTSATTRSASAGCASSTSAPRRSPRPACARARAAWT